MTRSNAAVGEVMTHNLKPVEAAPTSLPSRFAGLVLRPGRNVWRREHAARVSFLIDADAYFRAFTDALLRAERCVFILGWDIHSRTCLWPAQTSESLPDELGPFLNAVAARRPELQIYVLDWDFAMIYALEREALPLVKLGWNTHRRIHFHLDSEHPPAACHHQKIVVIDDALAFVGGLDLTINRWDTPQHRRDEPRRVAPNGKPYPPFHDVQIAVDGAAAAALAQLARERWRRVDGGTLPDLRRAPASSDPWPPSLSVDIHNADVGIARTDPAFDGRAEVREVENLYVDSIAAARRFLYFENQYLSSARAGAALASRLQEADGPEVVLITTRECSGWLEEGTMGALRARFLRQLQAADHHGRLRCYYPVTADDPDVRLNVHSKVMVVDDQIARVGSANLSNRSFGLDSECDVAIHCAGDARVAQGIAHFRNRLLAEHLGTAPEVLAQRIAQRQSLIAAIEDLRSTGRTLQPVEICASDWLVGLAPLADPEGPIDVDTLAEQMLPQEARRAPGLPLWPAAYLLVLAVLAAAWRWTVLGDWLQPSAIEQVITPWRHEPSAVVLVVGVFILAGFVAFPVTVLIVTTTLVFGPWLGFLYAVLGSLASAAAIFALGRALGRSVVRRIAGTRLDSIRRRISRRGIAVIATVRLFPLAPFSLINLVAGICRISFRDYLIGTLLGMAPGIAVLALFSNSLLDAVSTPSLLGSIGLFVTLAAVVALAAAAHRLQRRHAPGAARAPLVPFPSAAERG